MSIRRELAVFGLLCAAVWALTVWTWQYDARGVSRGMNGLVFWLHLAIPFAAAIIAWRRRRNPVVAAVVAVLADLGGMVFWDWLLHVLGRVRASGTAHADTGWVHVLEFAILFGAIGVAAGLAVSAAARLARLWHAPPR